MLSWRPPTRHAKRVTSPSAGRSLSASFTNLILRGLYARKGREQFRPARGNRLIYTCFLPKNRVWASVSTGVTLLPRLRDRANRKVFLAGMGALGLLTLAQGCSGGGGGSGGGVAGLPPLLAPGASPPAPSAVHTFGVSVTNGEYDPDIDLALVLATGAKIARMPFAWDRIEIGPKQYFWDYYDAIVPAMIAAGITPLLIAGVDNPVYGFGAAKSTAQLQAAADFYAVASARYRGAWWELGNEPDVAYFWSPAPDPGQYAAFVRAIAPAIRPYSSCIMSGGTSGINLGFISNYLALGVGNVVDCIAFHPYGVAP